MTVDSHVGDIGTAFILTIKDQDDNIQNVANASSLQIIFLKPDGATKLTKTATLHTDGTDGKVQYVTVAGDLDQSGTWKVQSRVVIGGADWMSSVSKFKVASNL